jgi:hypothetical protein
MIERLITLWKRYINDLEDPEAEQALNLALDEIAVAHPAATFEGASGPLE